MPKASSERSRVPDPARNDKARRKKHDRRARPVQVCAVPAEPAGGRGQRRTVQRISASATGWIFRNGGCWRRSASATMPAARNTSSHCTRTHKSTISRAVTALMATATGRARRERGRPPRIPPAPDPQGTRALRGTDPAPAAQGTGNSVLPLAQERKDFAPRARQDREEPRPGADQQAKPMQRKRIESVCHCHCHAAGGPDPGRGLALKGARRGGQLSR